MNGPRPLDRVGSIKVKLGLLVAVTIAVASVVVLAGTSAGVSGWVAVPLAVIVALVVTQVLARGMTSPLREMTHAAQLMARGDYSRRVRATSRDEVGELARAFNRMSATLDQVDRQRRDLVANVSHELRTPITALQAVLENLADGVAEPGPEELRAALAQTERLGRLVSDLLDLSRIEEGIVALSTSDVALAGLLREAVDQARVDQLEYVIDLTPGDLTVPADPDRLHQLLANLLDNASRHSPDGGTVRVGAERRGDRVVIAVSDDGPGIAPADRTAVFERFTTSTTHSSGTGLGLAISRWVAELHGGAIVVADTESGCRIEVDLPTEPPGPRAATKETTTPMNTLTPPAPQPEQPAAPSAIGIETWWPDARGRHPRLITAAVVTGVLAAIVLPQRDVGIGTVLVLAAIAGTVMTAGRGTGSQPVLARVDPLIVGLLIAMPVVRAAEWITVLCALAALALVLVRSTRASSVLALVLSACSVPAAGVRGLPWLNRSLRPSDGGTLAWVRVARTTVISVVLLVVFGALFASADALFASWVQSITPSLTWGTLPERVVIAAFFAAGTFAATFVALAPPDVNDADLPIRSSRHRLEWLVPLGVVNAVFALFLVAQATALFGGHDYLRRTTGLTYAEYVHQGFGQLTVATVLTLTVVAWGARKAEPGRIRDLVLGALCLMTIVVVISALHRMQVYGEAYGLTRLRLLVSVFEGWLGVVVLLVLVAGVVRRRGWLVPAAVRLGAIGLLALAISNPDLRIAEHNIARDDSVVPIDWRYLAGLSDDAVPAFSGLDDDQLACVTADRREREDDWLEWNLGRAKAADLLPTAETSVSTCPDPRL